MKAIGYVVVTILLMVYSALMNGWALCKLWAWFIEPTFGLFPMSIPAAIGLALVVSYLTRTIDGDKSESSYGLTLFKVAVASTLKPLFALAFGAVVSLWM